ncbi:DUF2169 family type VI secretion system accessory protein [Legionella sp. WA2022007384]
MKILKDKPHTVITFKFRHQGKPQLAVTIMTMFSFTQKGAFLSYADFWKVAKKSFNSSQGEFIDLYIPKKKAEFFVKGSCYAYDDNTSTSFVKITLGNMQKQLTVFGDRQWEVVESNYHLSKPKYFRSIPINLTNAYGGEGHAINPDGKGYVTTDSSNETKVPNVEVPTQLIKLPRDTPPPALLLPHTPTCKYQLDKLGTFNDEWLLNESPYYPGDIDWLYFNRAEEDQQSEHFFKGDEVFTCTNMHAEQSTIKSQLPGLRVRCFYNRIADPESLRELNLNLDTLWLLPDEEKGILIWHGMLDIQDIATNEIDFIYTVSESLNEPPKDIDYYVKLRNKPKEMAAQAKPRESRSKTRSAKPVGLDLDLDKEIREIAQIFHPHKSLDEIEAAKFFKGKTPEEVLSEVEQFYKNQNQTVPVFDKFTFERAQKNIHPQQVNHLDYLKKQIINNEFPEEKKSEILKNLEQFKQQFNRLDKVSALTLFRLGRVGKSPYSREEIIRDIQQGKEFASENLAGIDLSDLDLSGMDLSGCNLSECNLSRTRLHKANLSTATLINTNLSEAVLTHANLSQTLIKNSALNRADFKECDMHQAQIEGCSGKECNFSAAFFNYAKLKNCQFNGSLFLSLKANFLDISDSSFDSCNFSEARMQFANINRCVWVNPNFVKADLSHAHFDDTKLSNMSGNNLIAPKLSLTKCSIDNLRMEDSNFDHLSFKGTSISKCSFSNCSLSGLNLMNAQLTRAEFIKCVITKLRGNDHTYISTSNFEHCDLSNGAILGGHYEQISIGECDINSSQFINSTVNKSNFSKCNAKKFRFSNCKVDSCLFQDINFFQGIFYSSTFANTEFNHCNLYSIPFTDCQKNNVKILDCLVRNISLKQEESL